MNLNSIKARIERLFQKSLVRNTLWMMLSQGLRLVLQAAYFVIIARALGAEQYGAFIGATALAAILAPFASLGSGDILIKNVSRNPQLFKESWGNALFMLVVSSFMLLILVMVAAPFLLPKTIPIILLFCVALSDLFFLRTLDTASKAFLAMDLVSRSAQLTVLLTLKNLIAALIFVSFFKNPDILVWACLYLASTAVAALIACLLVTRMLGYPKLALSLIKPEIRQGFYFSISLSAQTINNDIDKTMLASLSTLEATGIYAAAYRLIDVAFVPVYALLGAAYAKFFQEGEAGIRGSLNFAKRLAPIAGGYGIAAGIVLFLIAPFVPYILGKEYINAVEAVRWLAPLLFLKAMQYFAADTLTGAGFQGIRSAMQALVAAFNFAINIWLIPLYSWRGAAWSSLVSDGVLMLGLWLLVAFYHRKQTQSIN